jgi:O-antigen ligase/tetratricopeptide (TPR) repeat protein
MSDIRIRAANTVVSAIVVALVILPPFALGAVHPWPATIVEIATFLLLPVWAARLAIAPVGIGVPSSTRLVDLLVPAILLAGLFIFQLMPLPPYLIRTISPSTYEVYSRSLQDWPKRNPYSETLSTSAKPTAPPRVTSMLLPTKAEVKVGAVVPFAHHEQTSGSRTAQPDSHSDEGRKGFRVLGWRSRFGIPPTWLPLSLAPSLTASALVQFSAYAALFFVVLGYPIAKGSEQEERFYRLVLAAVVITGVLVAFVGLLQRVYWNGKILWFFVPSDWGAPLPTLARVTGPFVNPDHFANYLAMVFPLALTGALCTLPLGPRGYDGISRMVCGTGAVIILVAIALSFSRAAWIETGASLAVLVPLWIRDAFKRVGEAGPELSTSRSSGESRFAPQWMSHVLRVLSTQRALLIGGTLVALVSSAMLVLFILGPENRAEANARVAQTIVDDGGIGIRPAVWKATLGMIGDFPRVGVGLAAWPEIFPRYEPSPWSVNYFREAHNDYLQYLSETGIVGSLLALAFVGLVLARIFAAKRSLPDKDWPLVGALLLGLGVMAFHELVDFPLHIPANALLFTLFLALVLRMCSEGSTRFASKSDIPWVEVLGLLGVSTALVVMALNQSATAYPYDIPASITSEQAREALLEHPSSAKTHLSLLSLDGVNMSQHDRLAEIASAVWLSPTDPSIRDVSAAMLSSVGRRKDALEEMRESVFNSPTLGSHFYLQRQVIPWLLPPEQSAVEQGFKLAVGAHYFGAVDELGSFYETLGRLLDQARLYEDAARQTSARSERAEYLVKAARAEIQAGDVHSAEAALRLAIENVPADTDAYAELVTGIYGPDKNLGSAIAMTKHGIEHGAEHVRMYLALASAAQMAGNELLSEKCLLKALRYDPSFQTIMQVGQSFLQRGHFDRATSMLRNAVEIKPSSAEAYYSLAIAQERSYQYSEAEKAYARAALLAPQQYRPEYVAFRRRMTVSSRQ